MVLYLTPEFFFNWETRNVKNISTKLVNLLIYLKMYIILVKNLLLKGCNWYVDILVLGILTSDWIFEYFAKRPLSLISTHHHILLDFGVSVGPCMLMLQGNSYIWITPGSAGILYEMSVIEPDYAICKTSVLLAVLPFYKIIIIKYIL